MAKPKKNETVVWDDDDVWGDFDPVAEPETAAEPEIMTKVKIETAGVVGEVAGITAQLGGEGTVVRAEIGPAARADASVNVEVEPQAESTPPGTVSTLHPAGAAGVNGTETGAVPVVQIRRSGISLVKQTVEMPVREVAKAAAPPEEIKPPPLPKTWFSTQASQSVKPSAAPQAARPQDATAKPPPLPLVSPTAKPPSPEPLPARTAVADRPMKVSPRKPPSGISSIFKRAEVNTEESTAVEPPMTDEAVATSAKPKKMVNPMLGPAFSHSEDTDRPGE